MNGIFIKSRGVGLIELLVTLLLLSISLLTLATLQSRSLQYNQGAYFRSQANIYAGDILDRMRNNSGFLTAYNITAAPYNLAGAPAVGNLTVVDVDQWRRALAVNLPNGQGGISCAAVTNICLITIKWDELSSNANENQTTLTYGARL